MTADLPSDLAAVVDSWPDLPEAVRAGIVAMVRASRPGDDGSRAPDAGREP